MGVKIVKDVNNVPELLEALEELSRSSVDIGIMGDSSGSYKNGMAVVDIARIQEYGATTSTGITIPERPFIRGTADNKTKEISQQVENMIEQVVHLKISPIVALNTIGESAAGITKEYLTDLRDPPNSPATIALKGSSNPLIDTGRLRQSITHKIK